MSNANIQIQVIENENPIDEPDIEASVLDARDESFMQRALRMLLGLQSPANTRRARKEGYSGAEHKEGWRLFHVASGQALPIDQLFEENGATVAVGADQLETLREIDDFENVWFPRVRAIVRRVVPKEHRDAFSQAFFKDLEQQPLGPGVVRSVGTFLSRVEGLATSNQPGAKEVKKTLQERGLTSAKLGAMRELVEGLQVAANPPARLVPAAEIAAAQEAQRAAVSALRDWFNDWATTLRPAFNGREQIKLGLTTASRGGRSDDEAEDVAPTLPLAAAPLA